MSSASFKGAFFLFVNNICIRCFNEAFSPLVFCVKSLFHFAAFLSLSLSLYKISSITFSPLLTHSFFLSFKTPISEIIKFWIKPFNIGPRYFVMIKRGKLMSVQHERISHKRKFVFLLFIQRRFICQRQLLWVKDKRYN